MDCALPIFVSLFKNEVRLKKSNNMKRDFLGDSYDLVKRFWRQLLTDWAPLFADPRFIPANLREEYSALTGIEMLPTPLPERFSIINDPDTGIRLPGVANQREGRTHTAINAIISQLEELRPKCIITFDQSDYRHSGQTLEQQRGTKLGELRTRLRYGFYYVSHAPFLFTFSNQSDMQYVQTLIVEAGIPAHRIQLPTGGSSLTF